MLTLSSKGFTNYKITSQRELLDECTRDITKASFDDILSPLFTADMMSAAKYGTCISKSAFNIHLVLHRIWVEIFVHPCQDKSCRCGSGRGVGHLYQRKRITNTKGVRSQTCLSRRRSSVDSIQRRFRASDGFLKTFLASGRGGYEFLVARDAIILHPVVAKGSIDPSWGLLQGLWQPGSFGVDRAVGDSVDQYSCMPSTLLSRDPGVRIDIEDC